MTLQRQDIPFLLTLPTIVKLRSINKAAAQLNISQPALSRGLKQLERAVGARLLVRSSRGVEITPVGEALLEHAQVLDAEIRTANSRMQTLANFERNFVRVGATSNSAGAFLGPCLQSILAIRQDIVCDIVVDGRPGLIERLQQGKLDVVLCPAYEAPEPGLKEETLFTITLGLYAGRHHPLAIRSLRGEEIKIEEVCAYDWVLPPQSSKLFNQLSNRFRQYGLPMPIAKIHTSSQQVTKAILRQGQMIAVQSDLVMNYDSQSDDFVLLRGRWNFGARAMSICQSLRTSSNRSIQLLVAHFWAEATRFRSAGTLDVARQSFSAS